MYKLTHSVRAYKMIFAVLERRLIQLLIKYIQLYSSILTAKIKKKKEKEQKKSYLTRKQL